MKDFLQASMDIIRALAGQPSSQGQLWFCVILVLFGVAVTLHIIIRQIADHGQPFFMTFVVAALSLASLVVILYLCQRFASGALLDWLQFAGGLIPVCLTCILVAVPVTIALLRCNYGEALLAWVVALIVGFLLSVLVNLLHDWAVGAKMNSDMLRQRGEEAREVMNP